ncbi:MAG: class I SAM-dependent methyltransferase [Runella slithyformis]|jgi:SAM-dependent methyltransferase|nr:MAG: class I SAM-dependent methyltransferase [Runella slithyformis]TAF95651.1 MAG: class I SAM-dependent methyltransferase [Runella sp.]TAG21229.1 MAG: class I SAM-dependent methyltransferase [Cytophagales bacterium]TAG40320.1 MAG: class I SAM-dependent methyltransferase [Cytophagia bacterium]TAF44341.1 MAG: class I SAM-dependent methyltransferase [Runella slithyformis]
MNQNYYKEYYHIEREHWWFLVRNQIIMGHLKKVLPTNRPLKILNVGIATGHTSELLLAFGNVKSVEYDQACFDFTRQAVPTLDLMQGSILELPFEDNSYDLVCALDVIEHVEDHQLAVNEMKRVCKPNGTVCVTVPAFEFLWNQHDDVNHHVRRYTRPLLESIFQKNGNITFSSYFNFWLFFPIAGFRLLSKILPLHQRNIEEAGSDFTVMNGSIFQKVFYRIFNSERFFINKGVQLPVGVSLLLTWKK